MCGFKNQAEADIKKVFLNVDEFAELHKVEYEGVIYAGENDEGIPIVLSDVEETDRHQRVSNGDFVQGLYLITAIMYCASSDLGGIVPEKGQPIEISDTDTPSYFHKYKIATSSCEYGMIRLELEAIGE